MLVSHRFPPDEIAGVERYTEALATELGMAGHAVSVLTRRPGEDPTTPHLLTEQLAENVSVYRLTGGAVDRARFLAHHERLEQLYESLLVEEVPDLVHINHVIDLSPHFIDVAYRLGIPVVLTLHDFYFACQRIILQKPSGELCQGPQGGRECARTCFADEGEHAALRWGMRTAYFRRLLTMVEQVICPSHYVANYFTQFADHAARIQAIPNGVLLDPPAIEPELLLTPQQRGQLNLAYLGAVVPHKGIHVLLDALALAGLERAQVVVFGQVGDPAYARKLRAQAEHIPGLTLRFYGAYEPDDLPHLLYDVDSVVVPSTWPETFSLVTREAMVQGIPVLASRLGALTEAIQDGENGFTFDPQRPEELAGQLRQLVHDESLLPRLRVGARATKMMTMAQHAAAIADVYRQALEGSRQDVHPGALEETAFQRDALLHLGFGAHRIDQGLLVLA
jgi:glycosyltransferase involved in cell wall biosynthesis